MSAYLGIWVGLHLKLAQLSGVPELAISEGEGKTFLTAAQNVMRHYPITASQKALDWGAFVFAAGAIYGPRIGLIVRRRQAPATAAQEAPQSPQFAFGTIRPEGVPLS